MQSVALRSSSVQAAVSDACSAQHENACCWLSYPIYCPVHPLQNADGLDKHVVPTPTTYIVLLLHLVWFATPSAQGPHHCAATDR